MEKQTPELKYTCNEENCTFKTEGLCLEGVAVQDCSHAYVLDDQPDENITDLIHEDEIAMDLYRFFSGYELIGRQADSIIFRNPTHLILLAGEPNCGKTTLIASLYDQFQKGSFQGYGFAGTRTIKAFEIRCHNLRVSSGSTKASMQRTETTEIKYLHLAVRKVDLSEPIQHLLFADISGELFQLARDSDEEIKSLEFFPFVDHIFFMVDGDLLSSSDTRAVARQNIFNLIGRAKQSNLLEGHISVNMIISKWDLVAKREASAFVESFFIKQLENKFPGLIKTYIKLAAQPESDNVSVGVGLDTFFIGCLEKKANDIKPGEISFEKSQNISEFQKFKYRENGHGE